MGLRRMAEMYGLTGLGNRRSLRSRLAEELERTRRLGGGGFSLLFMDLDDFKAINDEHGQPVGDEALKLVARVLKEDSRVVDTVARYGGEEFVALLPGTEGAAAFYDRFREKLLALSLEEFGVRLRLSAGAVGSGVTPGGPWKSRTGPCTRPSGAARTGSSLGSAKGLRGPLRLLRPFLVPGLRRADEDAEGLAHGLEVVGREAFEERLRKAAPRGNELLDQEPSVFRGVYEDDPTVLGLHHAFHETSLDEAIHQHGRVGEGAAQLAGQLAHPDRLLLRDQEQGLELWSGHIQLQPRARIQHRPMVDELILQPQNLFHFLSLIHGPDITTHANFFQPTYGYKKASLGPICALKG